MFTRLGTWCHDHRRLVVGLWVAAFLIGGALQAAGNSFRDEFNLPDSESRTGFDILDEHFGGEGTGINGTIVYQAPQGVEDPEVEQQMQRLFDQAAEIGSNRVRAAGVRIAAEAAARAKHWIRPCATLIAPFRGGNRAEDVLLEPGLQRSVVV